MNVNELGLPKDVLLRLGGLMEHYLSIVQVVILRESWCVLTCECMNGSL